MVSPLDNSADESWAALIAGRSAARPITRFDTEGFPVRFACEVQGFDAADILDAKAARRMDRCSPAYRGAQSVATPTGQRMKRRYSSASCMVRAMVNSLCSIFPGTSQA